jgi:hypothetical protein
MLVRKVQHDRGGSCYLASCPTTRMAVIVDPVAQTWRFYESILRSERLTLVAVVGSQPDSLRATVFDATESEPAWPCIRVRCTQDGMLKIGEQSATFFAEAPPIVIEDGVITASAPSAGAIDVKFGSARIRLHPRLFPEGFRLVALAESGPAQADVPPAWENLRATGGVLSSEAAEAESSEELALPKDPADITIVPVSRDARPAASSLPVAPEAASPNAGKTEADFQDGAISLTPDWEAWRDVIQATTTPAPVPSRSVGSSGVLPTTKRDPKP